MATGTEEVLCAFNLSLVRSCMVPANYNGTNIFVQAIDNTCIVRFFPRTRLTDIDSKWTSRRTSILLIPSAVDYQYTRLSVARGFEASPKGIHVREQAVFDVVG